MLFGVAALSVIIGVAFIPVKILLKSRLSPEMSSLVTLLDNTG
jgi:predicted membrane protein